MEHQIGLPSITEERLQEVEAELRFSLPAELRAYYKKENKFEAGEWKFHPIKDGQYIKRTWEDIVHVNSTDTEDYPDGLSCGLNWDAGLQGLELDPENVLEELEG